MGKVVVTGSQYLGNLIGDSEPENVWMNKKVNIWKEFVGVLARVVHRHP